ncbi:hypothetical protein SAMN05216374_2773 [Tardiphaga sp. OK246]|nr:hypothetical protein SAMN05216374_2773 [Tardiphaga sp. OK246]
MADHRSIANKTRYLRTASLALLAMMASAPLASAQEGEKVLRNMFDYVASQKNLNIAYDSDIEVVTPALQKIQFTASGQLKLSRPDSMRVTRTGGYTDAEFVFDGKTFTVFGRNAGVYAQWEAPGTIGQLVGRLRDEAGLDVPGADLLLARGYDELMSDVVEVKHIGRGVIDGKDCDHLAFRNPDVDWQVWIEAGDKPIPRKYIITSKAVTGAPQYTLRFKDWNTDAGASSDAFSFNPPAGVRKVDMSALQDMDEVPQATQNSQITQGAGK